jgi:hypothetical protein
LESRLKSYGIITFMDPKNTQIQVQEELLLAKQSRIEGNEGRARVCARRAAGAAVKLYLKEKDLVSNSDSALQSLNVFRAKVKLPNRIDTAVSWLVQRVDEKYNLPEDVDLISEANLVLEYLEGIDPDFSSGTSG